MALRGARSKTRVAVLEAARPAPTTRGSNAWPRDRAASFASRIRYMALRRLASTTAGHVRASTRASRQRVYRGKPQRTFSCARSRARDSPICKSQRLVKTRPPTRSLAASNAEKVSAYWLLCFLWLRRKYCDFVDVLGSRSGFTAVHAPPSHLVTSLDELLALDAANDALGRARKAASASAMPTFVTMIISSL
jgi:hypothetical protein